jgi:hypothetical protein
MAFCLKSLVGKSFMAGFGLRLDFVSPFEVPLFELTETITMSGDGPTDS